MRAFALLFPFITIASSLKSSEKPFCPAPVKTLTLAFIVGSFDPFRDRHCCADWACYGDTFKIKREDTNHFLVAKTDSKQTEWIEGN